MKNKAAQSLARKRWANTTPAERSAFAASISKGAGGRPRSTDRCLCGAMTAKRAAARSHHCVKRKSPAA
jgi:hypothetical protein